MKRLTFNKPCKFPLLVEELFNAFPEWIKTDPKGTNYTDVVVGGDDDNIELIVPDDADETLIMAIIETHNPDKLSINELADEEDKETKSHALTSVIADMTPQEAAEWVEDNVTDLASAKQTLKLMAKVLTVLVRELKKHDDQYLSHAE